MTVLLCVPLSGPVAASASTAIRSCADLAAADAARTTPGTAPPTAVQTQALLAWARAHALPVSLDAERPLAIPDDLQRFDAAIGDARVVAIGEPAHGAHEPLAFRNRLFHHLVEHHGFTAIAIESGFSESRYLDDYVLGRRGGHVDAAAVAREGMTWGFGGYAENVELLQWMRQYNEDPAHPRKLRIYGVDLSGGDGGEFPKARIVLDEAIAWLRKTAPASSQSLVAELESARESFDFAFYQSATATQRGRLHVSIGRLIAWLEQERATLVAASSEESLAWALRNAIVGRQLLASFQAWPSGASGRAPSAGLEHVVSARDQAMADNLLWTLVREGPQGRVLLFAHNAHVASAAMGGGMWSAFASAPTMMGQHLRPALGSQLRIIGTLSAKNGPGLEAAIANPGGLDDQLSSLTDEPGRSSLVLDLRQADSDALAAAGLARTQPVRTNFTTTLALSPRRAFDLVVLFRELTPARTDDPDPPAHTRD